MSQQLSDAEYKLELCQSRAARAEAELVGMTARYNECKNTAARLRLLRLDQAATIIAQEAALKIYRQDIDLWDWIDTAKAREHTAKAEAFANWYDKSGLIGIRNQRDALQGSFAKAVTPDV